MGKRTMLQTYLQKLQLCENKGKIVQGLPNFRFYAHMLDTESALAR